VPSSGKKLSIIQLKELTMRYDVGNCTLNGVPLEKVFVEETVNEMKSTHEKTVAALAFVVAKSRHIVSQHVRNHSGARSGKCRVIFSAGGIA
jgi:hypothetical protein